ncbi:type VI secretion system protein TssA [Variovorax sp. dw_308]|uniref:type VI secretion system protein TssA n=1 Tax=Variovorax sp. dw_308 TaxID=2721546 RepID=UPI002109B2C1|nr:type VI secretion system protein TssA [Variovorax sp. dw_308]
MAAETMLDLDALLAPIPGPSPCGPDMLFSPQFDAIQAARLQDDPSLEQGDWVIDLKEADWPFVIAESQKLLTDSTKDLRLGVWLTDALASRQGFAGLNDGYRLLTGLCECHWDDLHPQAEDGDMDMRFGSVSWLASRSIELVRRAPIVNDGKISYGAHAWEQALALEQAVKRAPSDADELTRGKITTDQFDRVRRATPAKFLQAVHADLSACEASVKRFEQVFDARTDSQGPSFARVKDMLESVRAIIERFARDAGVSLGRAAAPPAPVANDESLQRVERMLATPIGEAPGAVAAPQRGGIHTRAQAIAQLNEVADFFERTEPSSPTAYMAKKAASWANMSLHAWLRNVVKNEQELAQLEDLLGVRGQTPEDGN